MCLVSSLRRVSMPNELTGSSENFCGWEPGVNGSLAIGMAAVISGGECVHILSTALRVQGEFPRKTERQSFLLPASCFLLLVPVKAKAIAWQEDEML